MRAPREGAQVLEERGSARGVGVDALHHGGVSPTDADRLEPAAELDLGDHPGRGFPRPTVGQAFRTAGERECAEWLFQHLRQLTILAFENVVR
jgi:hypothetical protein